MGTARAVGAGTAGYDVANVVVAWALGMVGQIEQVYRTHGLSGRDAAALGLLASHPDGTMDWLQRRLGLSQSGTVRLVDRLGTANLLRRVDRSGHALRLDLTPTGRQLLAEMTQQRQAVVRAALAGLPDADYQALARLLSGLLAGTPRRRADADATCRWCDWASCGDGCPVDGSVTAE